MSYPRVNLLKKSEQRYQGAVSRRFLLVSAVVSPILLIAVLSGIKLVQYSGIQSDLKANREIWKSLEPKLSLFNEESRGLDANKKLLALFDGWQASQLPLVEMMDQIQDVVPANVQFSRFSLRGEVSPAVYNNPEQMAMDYKMLIEGSALGDRAEEDIWKFHRELLGSSSIAQAFDSIDLADMRKQRSSGSSSVREFRIVGGNTKGGAQ